MLAVVVARTPSIQKVTERALIATSRPLLTRRRRDRKEGRNVYMCPYSDYEAHEHTVVMQGMRSLELRISLRDNESREQ
jgi:hypothetical protein